MNSESQVKTLNDDEKLLLAIKNQRDKVVHDTKPRLAKLNVLDAMERHMSGDPLLELQIAVDSNPKYRGAFSFFKKSNTETLLHKVIALKDGETKEKAFTYKR